MSKENNNYASITAVQLLTIVFVVLKLCKVIEWSWVWVLSPLWISLIILAVLIIILVLLKKKRY